MAKYHISWKINLAAYPPDRQARMKLNETLWKVMDDQMKKGLVKDYGVYPDGQSGFLIGGGEILDVYRAVSMFIPYVTCEVDEVIPFEKQKEILREISQA